MQENNNNSEGKEIEFDVLTEIGNIGAGNATTALSQLINARIDMRVPKVDLVFQSWRRLLAEQKHWLQVYYCL